MFLKILKTNIFKNFKKSYDSKLYELKSYEMLLSPTVCVITFILNLSTLHKNKDNSCL